MNKQIFLSLALVALTSFSGAIGGNAEANSTNSTLQTEKTEKTVTKESTNNEQKTDASAIRAAYNRIAELCAAHGYKIGAVVLTGASLYILYKVMYKNCPWFKELVDGEAGKAPALPWETLNN